MEEKEGRSRKSKLSKEEERAMIEESNWYHTCGFILLVWLLFLDISIPPADLPKNGPSSIDSLGSNFIMVHVWKQPLEAQYFISAVATFWAISLWWVVGIVINWATDSNLTTIREHGFWSWIAYLTSGAGWVLRRWAKKELAHRFTYQISNPDLLIETGPYAYLVHPSYCGILFHIVGMIMIGLAAWDRSIGVPMGVVALAIAVSQIYLRIGEENVMLEKHFGQGWIDHCSDKYFMLPLIY